MSTATAETKTLSTYIQERIDEFSRSQKDVARYIVDHLDEAAFLTAEELARCRWKRVRDAYARC